MTRHCFSSGCRSFWHLGALTLASASVGCQFVFGDFTIQPDATGSGGAAEEGGASSTGGASATGGVSAVGLCDGSVQYSCSGNQLLACVGGHWEVKETCSTAGYCNAVTGACNQCSVGEIQCDAATDFGTQLSTCDDPTVGFSPKVTCVAPQYCSTTVSHCVACETNETKCIVDSAGTPTGDADTCSDDRTAWNHGTCGSGCTVIDGKHDLCATCLAGSNICVYLASGAVVLRTCVGGTSYRTVSECVHGCIDATSTTPASCAP